jgi:hypothetical protein
MTYFPNKKMNLTLVTTNNCNTCRRVETQLRQFIQSHKDLTLEVVNINDFKCKGIVIVPALLIGDELFAYGDIDEKKLLARLERLSTV